MTAHRTWWDYNAHRFARVETRRDRRTALYSMAIAALLMLAGWRKK